LLQDFSNTVFLEQSTLLLQPQNLRAVVTADGAELSWDPVEQASGYVGIIYSDTMAPLGNTAILKDTKYFFGNLIPNTKYYLAVKAVNLTSIPGHELIEGMPSDLLALTTLLYTPAKPSVSASARNWLSLTWPPVEGASYYCVIYNTTDTTPFDSWQAVNSPVNSVTIPNLTRETDYFIRIIAMADDNYSQVSPAEKGRTTSSEIAIFFDDSHPSDPVLHGAPEFIRQGEQESHTVTVETEGWDTDGFIWFLDGIKQNQYGNSFTIDYRLSIGPHVLTVIGKKDGIPYSTSIYFKVI
jgi:hypothetical protein